MSYISNVYDVLGDTHPGDVALLAEKKKAPKKDKPKDVKVDTDHAQNNNAQPQQQPAPSAAKVEEKVAPAPEKKIEANKNSSPKLEPKKDDKKPVEPKKDRANNNNGENKDPKKGGNSPSTAAPVPKETVSSPASSTENTNGDSPIFPDKSFGSDFRNERSGFRNDKEKRDVKDKGFTRDKDFGGQRGRANDRKSGSGRNPTENKRGGSGKGNWGGVDDEIKESVALEAEHHSETAKPTEEKGAATDKEAKTETPASTTATSSTPATNGKPAEEEDKSITYTEFIRKQKSQAVKIAAAAARQAGEGVDEKLWADFQPLQKEDPEKKTKEKGDW